MDIKEAKEILRPLWANEGPGITNADLIAFATEINRLRTLVKDLGFDPDTTYPWKITVVSERDTINV